VEDQVKPAPVEPPRGFFAASVDDKGRLKLPVNFQQFLGATGDQTLFVTSVDGRIARIYPISVWKENEKYLEELEKEDPEAAEALTFMTQHYGAESKMDGQGRVILPTEMRREFKLESEEVRVGCVLGAINVYSKAEYEQRIQQSRENLPSKINAAKTKGFR
jgi:MraZ protein